MIFIKITDKDTNEESFINVDKIKRYKSYYISTDDGLWHKVAETKEQISEKIRIAKKKDREDLLFALIDIKETLKYLR